MSTRHTHSLERFIEKVRQIGVATETLKKQADQSTPNLSELTSASMSELLMASEELLVAEEELQQQHTALQNSRNLLEHENQRYHDLFEFAPDGYLVTDQHGMIREANQSASFLFNVSKKYLIGKPLSLFLSDDERSNFRIRLLRLAEDRLTQEWDIHLKPRHNELIPIAIKVSPAAGMYGENSLLRWLLRDVTARKQAEKQLLSLNAQLEERVQERTASLEAANQAKDKALEQEKIARTEVERANQLKTRFLGIISHEMRTPLTSIKGFVSTLLADDVIWSAEEQHDFLQLADEEADRLKDLIGQLLDFSQIESGKIGISLESKSLYDIVKHVTLQLHMLTEHHHLEVNLPQTLPLVMVDSHRIMQVLVNLIGNATKYSPPQSKIELSADIQNNFLYVHVKDTGRGIPPEDRERVFEAFLQVGRYQHGSTATKGVGLGLAICKGIIEEHGGKIWVEENEKPGTTFTFTLPISG